MAQASWYNFFLLFISIKNISGQQLIRCSSNSLTNSILNQNCLFSSIFQSSLNVQIEISNFQKVTVNSVSFENSRFQVWTRVFCNTFLRLETILAGNIQLEAVEEDALVRCVWLKWLDFRGNSLKTLPPRLFEQSSSLNHIDLSENFLTILNFNIFRETSSLENLVLESNRIEDVSILPSAQYLKGLYLDNNQIRDLHTGELRKKYPALQFFSISNNNILCRREENICEELRSSNIKCIQSICLEEEVTSIEPEQKTRPTTITTTRPTTVPVMEETTVNNDVKPNIENMEKTNGTVTLVFIIIGSLVLLIVGAGIGWKIKRSRQDRTVAKTPEVKSISLEDVNHIHPDEEKNKPNVDHNRTVGGVRRSEHYYEYVPGFYDVPDDYDDITAAPYDHLQFNQK